MNDIHETNRRGWDIRAATWTAGAERSGVWHRWHREPDLALHARERHWLGDVAGQRIAVLGSGDNAVVFALAGLGAHVTSVDISQNQFDVARRRAAEFGLAIAFVCSDVTELTALADGSFDLVFTGGHVAVWVSDLNRFYAEAVRILRPGGRLVVSEYHPFRRPWKPEHDRLEIEFSYFDRGPHEWPSETGVPGLMQYEFHWTVGDYVQAVLQAGCRILAVEEFGDEHEDWERAPLTGLPRVLLIVGEKP